MLQMVTRTPHTDCKPLKDTMTHKSLPKVKKIAKLFETCIKNRIHAHFSKAKEQNSATNIIIFLRLCHEIILTQNIYHPK
jgi:hypothetical protein